MPISTSTGIKKNPARPHDVWVTVPAAVQKAAWDWGVKRQRSSEYKKHKCQHNFDKGGVDGARLHGLGALAECVAAMALGVEWTKTIDTFQKPDLPNNVEVRTMASQSYDLKVRGTDKPERRVVGVLIPKGGEAGPYCIPGWYQAGDAHRHPEWIKDPHNRNLPFYDVPLKRLRRLESLRLRIFLENEYDYHFHEFTGLATDSSCPDDRAHGAKEYAQSKVDQLQEMSVWSRCPEDCGEFWCSLHQQHAHECGCLEIDELDFDPYEFTLADFLKL